MNDKPPENTPELQELRERAHAQPPGLIVLPIGSRSIYPEFFIDYQNLTAGHVPPGTVTSIRQSGSVVENLNSSLKQMQPHHQFAFIMGDDHRFAPDLLIRLLEHDKDVVVPLGVRRVPPFLLGIFKEEAEFWDEGLQRDYPGYLPYNPDEVPDELFTVVASGSAGMLVRRPVLDAIGFPWFESSDGVFLNEDLEFCRRVRALGYDIWCDPHALLGHIGQMAVWPHWFDHPTEGRTLVIKIDHGGNDGENEVLLGTKKQMVSA